MEGGGRKAAYLRYLDLYLRTFVLVVSVLLRCDCMCNIFGILFPDTFAVLRWHFFGVLVFTGSCKLLYVPWFSCHKNWVVLRSVFFKYSVYRTLWSEQFWCQKRDLNSWWLLRELTTEATFGRFDNPLKRSVCKRSVCRSKKCMLCWKWYIISRNIPIISTSNYYWNNLKYRQSLFFIILNTYQCNLFSRFRNHILFW